MTMDEALDHEWLVGPSSQTTESQRQRLGGDSMWAIESFEDEDSVEMDDGYQWTRPTTVSGTNFESGIGGDFEESFSQPMGLLRIDRGDAGHGRFSKVTEEIHAATSIIIPTDASPPSPPLTEEAVEGPGKDCKAVILALDDGPLKRKLSGACPARSESDGMFSSGSLSPPPEEPGASESALLTPQSPVLRGGAMTRAMRKRGVSAVRLSVSPDRGVATRQSIRTANRPRKSLRLV